MYGKKIGDPYKEIKCPEYFEDAFAMAMTPEFDDDFFQCALIAPRSQPGDNF